jgi:hypothetical protein
VWITGSQWPPRSGVRGVTEGADGAPHTRRIAGGSPATRDRWVRESTWMSAGGRQEHLVDDVHDAVAGLDVGLDD